MYILKARTQYTDLEENKVKYRGDMVYAKTLERAKKLMGDNPNKIKYAELVGIIKDKPNPGPKIIIFQTYIYFIGGIETFIFNLTKHYKDRNILVLCDTAEEDELLNLGRYADVMVWDHKQIDCDVLIMSNYDNAKILNDIHAKKVYQMVHADWEEMTKIGKWKGYKWKPDSRTTKVITVSDTAHDGLKRSMDVDSEVIYNILDYDYELEDERIFITLSRLSEEKGAWRIVEMANRFRAAGKRFKWFVCGTLNQAEPRVQQALKAIPEIIIIPPMQGNKTLIRGCDYLVQLSDTESFCYSAFEALQRGVPVILTDFVEAQKIVKPGKNGYLVHKDLSDLDIDKIFDHVPKDVTFEDRCDYDKWEKVFKGEL